MTSYVPFTQQQVQARPWSPVSAVQAGDQYLQNREAQALSLESMTTANQQAQANLQRYQGQTPNELDKSNLEGLVARQSGTIPGYGTAIGQGRMGEAQQQSAKGQVAQGTVDTDIARSRAKSFEEISGSKTKGLEYIISGMDMHLPALESAAQRSPLEAQAQYSKFLQDMPPQMRDIFPQSYSPEAHEQLLEMKGRAVENLEHGRKMLEHSYHEEMQNYRTRYTADAQVQRERERAAAKNQSYDTMMREAKTVPHQLGIASLVLSDPDASPEVKAKALALQQQAAQTGQANNDPRYPGVIPGFPTQPRAPFLPGGGSGNLLPGGPIEWERGPDGKPRPKQR